MEKVKSYSYAKIVEALKQVEGNFSKIVFYNDDEVYINSSGIHKYKIIRDDFDKYISGEKDVPQRALVLGPIATLNQTIEESLSFAGWIFAAEVTFVENVFSKTVDFSEAAFVGGVDFSKTRFVSEAIFTGCLFASSSSFNETIFEDACPFRGSVFSSSVQFNWTTFATDPEFTGSVFAHADFSGASFMGEATFSGVTFEKEAFFSSASFGNNCEFSGVTFKATAEFTGSMFMSNATFTWSAFLKNVSFSGATFSGEVSFSDAKFEQSALFSGTIFEQNALFGSVIFMEDADFSGAAFLLNVDFSMVQFKQNAHFMETRFEAEGYIHFEEPKFYSDAFFTGAIIDKKLYFKKAEFARRADFSQSAILKNGFIHVEECFFNSLVDFSNLQELSGKLYVRDSDFLRKFLINFYVLRGENARFNALVINHEDKESVDYRSTRDNFESFEDIFNRNKELDNELEIHYFVKVYERLAEYEWRNTHSTFQNIMLQIPKFLSWAVLDKTSKYFTSWIRTLISIGVIVVFFTMLYCLSPFMNVITNGRWGLINGIESNIENASSFFVYVYNNLYFSLITFTTIGYGDILPTGLMRLAAGLEGFAGVTLTSLFLVTLGKKVLG